MTPMLIFERRKEKGEVLKNRSNFKTERRARDIVVVECPPSIHKVLGSIPNTERKKQTKQN